MSGVTVGGRVLGLPASRVRQVVHTVLGGEDRDADISITFLGPDAMRRLNQRHKQHDRPTDVLSFPLATLDGRLLGDVYVCRAVARKHAAQLGISSKEELVRLIVHGVLHVLGYDHPEGEERERSEMWRRQERYVRKALRAKSP